MLCRVNNDQPGVQKMHIEISPQQARRVQEALNRRAELLRLTTHRMPDDWSTEMQSVETIIAAVVARAVEAGRRE